MKKFIYYLVMMIGFSVLGGCASVHIPTYIKDESPYTQRFYANYEDTFKATVKVLELAHWDILKTTDPAVFESNKSENAQVIEEELIITNVRPLRLFLGTRYARINVYLRAVSPQMTEVEIRFLSVNSIIVKSFENYKHDREVSWLLNQIRTVLQGVE